jgi:hypothetical protein
MSEQLQRLSALREQNEALNKIWEELLDYTMKYDDCKDSEIAIGRQIDEMLGELHSLEKQIYKQQMEGHEIQQRKVQKPNLQRV